MTDPRRRTKVVHVRLDERTLELLDKCLNRSLFEETRSEFIRHAVQREIRDSLPEGFSRRP